MKLDLQLAPIREKPLIRKMLEHYLYELSEYSDNSKPQAFEYPYLDQCWTEPHRHPFIVRLGNQPAGFVFVNQFSLSPNIDHSIAEFYIAPAYRKQGLGKRVAWETFDRFPGRWEVRVLRHNRAAHTFWTQTIAAYANQNLTQQTSQTDQWSGTLWTFPSNPPR